MSSKQQVRRWCATLQVPDGEEWLDGHVLDRMMDWCSYYVAGREVAKTGQRHWQIYMETKKKITMGGLKKLFNPLKPHLEIARGTQTQNREYCTKDGDFTEWGDPLAQGSRGDVKSFVAEAARGATDKELCDAHPSLFLQYGSKVDRIRAAYAEPRDWETQVIVITGPTGCGKTSQAKELDAQMVRLDGGRFIVGYDGSKDTVCFDEFEHGAMKLTFANELCDRYACKVPVKGGDINWAPRCVIFTSNDALEDWWPKENPLKKEAFMRRITQHKEFASGEKRALGQPCINTAFKKARNKEPESDSDSDTDSVVSRMSGHARLRRANAVAGAAGAGGAGPANVEEAARAMYCDESD